ncbi:CARDB domain-containing protein, partial [Salinirubellus sp. GCM10025899]|uniref:CARDB domain-containing protein n=1 Tax=Salinirubellus sp. GCM10025899 TaxID=3252689 RepID=UPI00360EC5B7
VSFNVTISNRGEAAAKNVNYVIKNNDTGDFIANPPTVTLDPGEAHTARLIGEFTIQEPPVNVTAIVDPGNDIQETYENNNKRDLRIGSQRQVSLSEISFTIQKVNGEDRGSDVVPVEDAFVKSLTVKAVGPEGRPLSGLSLRLNNAIQSKEGISVTEVDPGSYKFSGSPALGSVMTIQKYDIYLANDGTENSKTLQLPVRDPGLPLPGPIEGWGALQSVTVSVEGNTYTAVNMFQWTSESKDSSYGWVVYDSSDNLVTDPQIQKKAGKTAVVSLLTNHYEKRWEEFLGEDYPKNIDEFLMADFVLQGSVAVRDASAYTLGTITAIQTARWHITGWHPNDQPTFNKTGCDADWPYCSSRIIEKSR